MPGQASQDLFQQATDLFAQRVQEYADGIAQRLGQPMSGQQLSKDQVLQRWNFSPLGSTQAADMTYHQLVAQGMQPGQALDQVYPFRKMLFAGPDLKSQIDTAKQIAGWHADATGTEPPQPNPNLLPSGVLPPAPALAGPGGGPPPLSLPGAPPVAGGMGGAPLPVQPPPVPPVPGAMPPVNPGGQMPGIQPVPMAGGGVVTSPTVALIGEQGPEAVVPLTDVTSGNYPGTQAARQLVTMWDDVIRPHAGEFADDPQFLRIAAAAAQAESSNNPRQYQYGYNPNDPRTWNTYGGRGLWQFDINQGAKGYGVPEEQLFDPNYQASVIVPEFARNYARLKAANPNMPEAQLAAMVYGATEYPEGTIGGRWKSPNERAYQNYVRAYTNLAPPRQSA